MRKDVYVYASWSTLQNPTLMGVLTANYLKGKETFAFEFDPDWLKAKKVPRLDPDLPLVRGKSFPTPGKQAFGIFSDAAPDRWGRRLMIRREAALAREEKRPERTLLELDFLLGIDDAGRLGALRFKKEPIGTFLADDRDQPTPPITDLRKLERAAIDLEQGNEAKVNAALEILLRPGSSLGGARPKANVVDSANALWIAKFPSGGDDMDIGGWEQVAASLARASGIIMSESKAIKLGSRHHTFVTKRFDRSEGRRRHLYASAMTLLGHKDGDSHTASYLELAEILISQGTHPKAQLVELWRRLSTRFIWFQK